MNRKHWLFCLALTALTAAGQPAAASPYVFTDLGALGGVRSIADGINSSGVIAGAASEKDSFDLQATLWTHSKPDPLAPLQGGISSRAYAVNEAGMVAGWSTLGGDNFRYHATVWEKGKAVDLGTLGGDHSVAEDINTAGIVVGRSHTAPGSYETHATRWHGTSMTDLGTAGGRYSAANAINDSGQIAGIATLANGSSRAAVWNGSTLTTLDTLGGDYSYATSINNAGVVAGHASLPGYQGHHAAMWVGEQVVDLGTLGGEYSSVRGMNNVGQMVGFSRLAVDDIREHATLWNGTELVDLNSLLDPVAVKAGWTLLVATDINDHGVIVGNAHNELLHVSHAFKLTPIPEPQTWAMLMAGMGCCLLRCARRRAWRLTGRALV